MNKQYLYIAILCIVSLCIQGIKSYKNVNGGELGHCSTSGVSMTGFTRNGQCIETDDDAGSHHICIDLKSVSGSSGNFCVVTGQPNWCDTEGSCFKDPQKMCPRKHWCVCQWAFAKYKKSWRL